jgi:hypothetical protein
VFGTELIIFSFEELMKKFVIMCGFFFCFTSNLALSAPTGTYRCFISYPDATVQDSTCFNSIFSIDFNTRTLDSSDTCKRGVGSSGFYNLVIKDLPFSMDENVPVQGATKITTTWEGITSSIHFLSVNSGNSLFVQGTDFRGSGVCHRP